MTTVYATRHGAENVVSARLTYAQAADLLGCHVSNIPKLIRKGYLTSERRRDGALDRADVERLAALRAWRAANLPPTSPGRSKRPDRQHEWLRPSQVAGPPRDQ